MKYLDSVRLRILSVLFVAIFAHASFGQETGASLVGIVRDSAGAMVPGATVSATDVGTNARTTQQANGKGEYSLLNLAPGTYSLHIEASGFRGYDQTGIRLELNQHATQDVSLALGQVSQTISVNADVSGLDTVTSVISDEVNGQSLRDLPLNARNPFALLELIPGFSGSVGDDYNSNSFSLSGGRQGYHDTIVDGTPAGFPTVNGNAGIGVFPSIDAIGEFHVFEQNYPAEYGRSLDGIINVVFKSGANQFHGSLFEFIRNSALDSNSYFSNLNKVPLPLFHRNQYGGELSGPIYKNKTFFMVSTELLRANQENEGYSTVPTALQRTGDFSQTLAPNGQPIQIYNPFTTTCIVAGQNPCTSGYTRSLFAGGKINIPLNAVALKAISYYPLPNVPGAGATNNYFANGGEPTQTTAWDVRVDHTISERQKVFARYSNRFYESYPEALWPAADAVAEGLIDGQDFSRGVTIGYTAFPKANMIYDARIGFARTLYNYLNNSLGFQDSTLGLPSNIDAATSTPLFPVLSPAGYTGLGNNGNRHNAFMTYSLVSSLTWVHGPHSVKVGFDGRLIRVNDHESADSAGNFSFGTNFTQLPNIANSTSGNGLATFLLGIGTGDVIQEYKDDASQSYYLAGYGQDDWRVNPKLTLNLGLRYDIDTPRTDRFNRMNYFNPTIASPLASYVPGLQGGWSLSV
ncbi:TonB-dependent receptor [Granulicella paludicola]|uniref:TonB-dependent receptor n=1 Tax=Granulicella paludicola TaxID=474951 RepID=UPI0021DFE5D3|nr:TonB-dependent receptor [Granulicella paludicola]